jgi:hypothetical protein
MNSADKGELCEIFIKNFLRNYLDDHYKIFRGGNVINLKGEKSPQLDIIITNRACLKIFEDKGIYPIETLIGVLSITSTLTHSKLKTDLQVLASIPKRSYCFKMEKYFGEKFFHETHKVWEMVVPFSCIFGFEGDLKSNWHSDLTYHLNKTADKSLCPTLVIVNKVGMFEKINEMKPDGTFHHYYRFISLKSSDSQGMGLGVILNDLYNLSREQYYRHPDYDKYFQQDF